jgi:hypothetical protein
MMPMQQEITEDEEKEISNSSSFKIKTESIDSSTHNLNMESGSEE